MIRRTDAVGVVLSRNEVWLLLNALATSQPPALLWDGDPLAPWHLGDLQAKLRGALHPDPLKDVDRRPVISVDSELGKDLASAGIKPLISSDIFDIGSLLAACAERGWGAELVVPRGATPSTPADAVVRVRREGAAPPDDEATYVGVERPVVALARALIGALLDASNQAAPGDSHAAPDVTTAAHFEEFVIPGRAVGSDKNTVIKRMGKQGWELVLDDIGDPQDHLVFRRPAAKPGLHGDG